MLGVEDVCGEAGKGKKQTNKQAKNNKKKLKKRRKEYEMFLAVSVSPLTGARDDSKNIFMQAGVQEGAGARRRHQSVGEETIFSSILKIRKHNIVMQLVCEEEGLLSFLTPNNGDDQKEYGS